MKKLFYLTLLAPFAANAADISRNAEVSLPQRKHTIVFDGLPAAMEKRYQPQKQKAVITDTPNCFFKI